MSEQRIFMCGVHQFVTVVRGDEVNCRDSPGRRQVGCPACDQVVDDAFACALVSDPFDEADR